MKRIFGIVVVSALAGTALAIPTPLVESEANNTYGTANFVAEAFYPFGGVAIDGRLSPGDVDYISFDLRAGDYVTAAIYDWTAAPLGGSFFDDGNESPIDNDSFMGVFGPGGVLFDRDDDAGPGFLSAIHFYVPVAGRWAFAITGFGDTAFDGTIHAENFQYKFVFGINPIPEPATIGLLLAGLALLRRR